MPTGNAGPWQVSCRGRASGWGGWCGLDSTDNGTGFTAAKPNGKQWDCGFANEHFYAGFPHLYWAGTALPRRFVDAAAHYHQEEQDQ